MDCFSIHGLCDSEAFDPPQLVLTLTRHLRTPSYFTSRVLTWLPTQSNINPPTSFLVGQAGSPGPPGPLRSTWTVSFGDAVCTPSPFEARRGPLRSSCDRRQARPDVHLLSYVFWNAISNFGILSCLASLSQVRLAPCEASSTRYAAFSTA